MRYPIFVPALILVGSSATTEQGLAQQSAAAWQCAARDIKVEKIDVHAYRVAGCCHQADYACPVEGGSAGGSRCEVVSGE
jgi:hypothetical protein